MCKNTVAKDPTFLQAHSQGGGGGGGGVVGLPTPPSGIITSTTLRTLLIASSKFSDFSTANSILCYISMELDTTLVLKLYFI